MTERREAAKEGEERRETAKETQEGAPDESFETARREAGETREAATEAVERFSGDKAATAELSIIASEAERAAGEIVAAEAEAKGEKPPEPIEVPVVLPETGLTQDYNNEFAWITGLSDMEPDEADEEYEYLAKKAAERKGGKIMREYQEVYPADRYKEAVTDKNSAGVAEINAVVNEVNDLHAAGKLTREKFLELSSKINGIIVGTGK